MPRSVSTTLVCLLALALPACQEETLLAPMLTATCEARPASGPAPLAVTFLLNIAGAEGAATVAISYGDGQTGSNPDAPHTYTTGGSYTASFDVRTATQSARCSAGVTVSGSATPSGGGNQPPVAVFKTSPGDVGNTITGPAPLAVSFNMCASSDPEDDELYFLMDFDGDEKFDFGGITGFHCRADRVYALGTWEAVNCLYDRDKNKKALHPDICRTYTIVAQ